MALVTADVTGRVPPGTPDLALQIEEVRRLTRAPVVRLRKPTGGYLSPDGALSPAVPGAFVLENLSGHDSLTSGDTVRLRTPGADTCLSGAIGARMRLARLEHPAGPEQQFLVRRLDRMRRAKPVFAEGGPIAIGDHIGISFFKLESDVDQPPGEWVLESPRPDDPAWTHRQDDVDRRRANLQTMPRRFAPVPSPGATISGTDEARLTRVDLNGRVYFHDVERCDRFHYLPDRVELLTLDGDEWPALRVYAAVDVDTYVVEYMAAPLVEAERVQSDAATGLLAAANRLTTSPVLQVSCAPLLGHNTSLSVRLPDARGWHSQPRPETISDLRHAFSDAFIVNAEGLRQLYDALFDITATPFRGIVEVTVGRSEPQARHQVPFVGRVFGDRDALWPAVFDASVPARFMRRVDVLADHRLFADATSVAVSFEFGGGVMLTSHQTSGFTDVGQPIGDYVTRRPDAGTYRYQLTVATGGRPIVTDWRTGRGAVLRLSSWK